LGKIIAVSNQKGGVGKTTTAVNLAAALGQQKKKTLLVDVDSQGSATSALGESKKHITKTAYDVIMGNVSAADAMRQTRFSNLWLIAGGADLGGCEIELADLERRELMLKKALAPIRDVFDYILIDCPPAVGLIDINALSASDSVLIPMQPEYFALEGLAQLTNTISLVRRNNNATLEIEGVLITMYDSRLNLTHDVIEQVKQYFPRQIFKTVIPRSIRFSEAQSYGEPITYFDKKSKGADSYEALAKEIIRRNKR
jgi:chromosome partitioning protein